MTVTVCLNCGSFKHGAFIRCRECGYEPEDDESLTKHLLVTDHFLSGEQLKAVAAKVKAKEPIEFAQESLKAAWVSKTRLDAEKKNLGRACSIGCIIVIAVSLAALVAFLKFDWRPR
ncbi:MAG TPA: hypothetical protein VGY55_12200 [Pirellulales bacterium]|jgi:hypothetical protein|nr:hypothetical protein [Pirellulales bacterium]